MRLQNLLIIFVVIALPVIMVLSVYIGYQIDAANLQAQYDSKFLGATYDMLSAFQLNTTNNKYSTVSDSTIRDIEASINIFSNSFGSSQGISGTSKSDVMSYVPALLFTLYDGYYIYTPTKSPDTEAFEHGLKPYVYYTEEYTNNNNERIVINYSLDNYVAVYYDNDTNTEESYRSRAGYLEVIAKDINDDGIYIDGDYIYYNGNPISKKETLIKNNYKYDALSDGTISNFITTTNAIESKSAYEYYKAAYDFTNWYNDLIRNVKPYAEIKIEDKSEESGYRKETKEFTNDLIINEENQALPGVGSYFNDEKNRVIQSKITDNLIQTMETYKKKTSVDFKMPEFTVYDWEKITNNVCVVSFVQGLVVGTTTYNNYVILPSTENEQYMNEKELYYIGYKAEKDSEGQITGYETDGYYHRINCPKLLEKHSNIDGENMIIGYNRTEFLRQVAIDGQGNQLKEKDEKNRKLSVYYYPHDENACYYCIVNAQSAELETENELLKKYKSTSDEHDTIEDTYELRKLAYYKALAREKYDLLKASQYINGSAEQK